MTEGVAKKRRTLRIGNGQITLDWKFWLAFVGAGVIIWIGFSSSTKENPYGGVLASVSTVVGTLVGVALQFQPVPLDQSPRAEGAIRGLGIIAQLTNDTNVVVGQVATTTKEARTSMALASVQTSLTQISVELQMSMVQWDGVAPGSLTNFEEDRKKGSDLLRRMTEANDSE
ncbi:hypothetical protein [Microbacterium sp. SL75]|uniref:hypothetical protein n=1 Tax=Microbacterium sp. SL75 TaxID=2995140 RepID=UPI00226EDEC0|nr:hypothetical protein [Microbacterium sp. SL75]WAC69350.1 hypothetical protein OVA17_01230 [Microbacterium sp. SL75]